MVFPQEGDKKAKKKKRGKRKGKEEVQMALVTYNNSTTVPQRMFVKGLTSSAKRLHHVVYLSRQKYEVPREGLEIEELERRRRRRKEEYDR